LLLTIHSRLEGDIKTYKAKAIKDADHHFVVKNVAGNTYFDKFTGMTTLGCPEHEVTIAKAKLLNATHTNRGSGNTRLRKSRGVAFAGVYMCNGSNWKGGC
jgi:hypothetical protein